MAWPFHHSDLTINFNADQVSNCFSSTCTQELLIKVEFPLLFLIKVYSIPRRIITTSMPILTFTIIITILNHLPSAELLRVSIICRATRTFAVCAVLLRGVELKSIQQLFQFSWFLNADLSKRLPYLHKLKIMPAAVAFPGRWGEGESLTQHFVNFLLQVFTRTRHLRVFHMKNLEYFLMRYLILQDAFLRYDGLVDLVLGDVT